MQRTPYSSVPGSINVSLAEASFEAFRPFVSRYQWALGDPCNSPRKAEVAHALLNRGKPEACTFHREGGKYILPVLHARHFERAIANRYKIYYVSHGKYALLYLDVDLHHAWQTPEEGREARRLLDALLTRACGKPVLFWAESSRGHNGYLKVDLRGADYGHANGVFARLEAALRRFLAHFENLADFEIKGRLGYLKGDEYAWASYGKLPVHGPDWDFARLEEFQGKPAVRLTALESVCRRIEGQVPLDVLERHQARKKGLGGAPMVRDGSFLVTAEVEQAIIAKHGNVWWPCMFVGGWEDDRGGVWLPLKYYRPGQAPVTEWELRKEREQAAGRKEPVPVLVGTAPPPEPDAAAHQEAEPEPVPMEKPPPPKPLPSKLNIKLADLTHEPDSFVRQKEALSRLARYLKRVPSQQEALRYVRAERLFTPPWDQHLDRRKARVRSILNFIALTFDPAKCAKGAVNVDKYGQWAEKKFPQGLIARGRKDLTEYGEVVEGQGVQVSHRFIAAFVAVCEFALLIDKNRDGSLPHRRAEELWQALHAKGLIPVRFCARKWAACRDELERHDIVKVTDRDYSPGKAMRWEVGVYFPFLGRWKGQKQRSVVGGGSLPGGRRERREQEHNTWLCQRPPGTASGVRLMPARPPPGRLQLFREQEIDRERLPGRRQNGEGALLAARSAGGRDGGPVEDRRRRPG
jgi:hypothetical protein